MTQHRCPVCDTTEGAFIKDPYQGDYLCTDCAFSIQDAAEIDWAEVGEVGYELFEVDERK